MSQLDKLYSDSLSMEVLNSLNIPEVAVPLALSSTPPLNTEETSTEPHPFSPTLSVDSGRWTGTTLWPSTRYFVHGGPGFSIGILDSNTGLLERLPIPVPTQSFLESDDESNFSFSKVTCLVLAGESQVWTGTETGSLHVFDLIPGPRLTKHFYTKLPEPVTFLRTDQTASTWHHASPPSSLSLSSKENTRHLLMRTEILAGSPNGNLTIISGDSDERGGLRNVSAPRKLLPLRGFESEGNSRLHCITLVSISRSKEDCYWCGCGHSIVILRRADWKILGRLDGVGGGGSEGHHHSDNVYVSQLVSTEHGVWSTMTQSSTMLLWNPRNFTSIMRISCFNSGPKAPLKNMNAEVTSLVYSEPLLLVGTLGGYLLVFSINRKLPENKSSRTRRTRHTSITSSTPSLFSRTVDPYKRTLSDHSEDLDYTFIAATHCCVLPVVSIHPIGGIQATMCESTPSHSLNILVLFGSSENSEGFVQLYEMITSPLASPMTSPLTSCGRMSSQSEPASLSRRCNLQDLDHVPKLTLLSVSKGSVSYLPLQENSQ